MKYLDNYISLIAFVCDSDRVYVDYRSDFLNSCNFFILQPIIAQQIPNVQWSLPQYTRENHFSFD